MQSENPFDILTEWIKDALIPVRSLDLTDIEIDDLITASLDLSLEDLETYAERDPAAKNDQLFQIRSSISYKAVVFYRVAHELYSIAQRRYGDAFEENDIYCSMARSISERAKVETGVEIHPAAQIGARFVIDHGFGTVIGETAIVGDECYFLQMVVLGAESVADGPDGRRHPKVGNNVTIAGSTWIIGNIEIGDNVEIHPGCKITKLDVPPDTTISMLHSMQRGTNSTLSVYGVVPVEGRTFDLHGAGWSEIESVTLLRKTDGDPSADPNVQFEHPTKIEKITSRIISFTVTDDIVIEKFSDIVLCVHHKDEVGRSGIVYLDFVSAFKVMEN